MSHVVLQREQQLAARCTAWLLLHAAAGGGGSREVRRDDVEDDAAVTAVCLQGLVEMMLSSEDAKEVGACGGGAGGDFNGATVY